jgi:aminoglycoside phosphotransferase (APT) family kinase protein
LWDNDSVSAVLDWGAFRFEEPAFDVAYIIVKLRAFYPQRLHGVSLNVYIDRYFRSYNERRNIGRDRFSYFEAVGALNALNEIKTHINDLRARGTSTIQLLDRVEDDMINLFEEVSGVKIPNSVS